MNVLFAASEAVPYAASGGLADVIGSLPSAICEKGNDCRIVMPLYKTISKELRNDLKFIKNITIAFMPKPVYKYLHQKKQNG